MSKVVTVHGHTLELDMGPSCPNPGIRRQLDANEEVFLFVGEEPPIMDDDGEWVDPRKEGLFWSEEDFNFDFDKLLGTVKFPELNKGERIEMNLQFEFGIK